MGCAGTLLAEQIFGGHNRLHGAGILVRHQSPWCDQGRMERAVRLGLARKDLYLPPELLVVGLVNCVLVP